MRERVHTLHRMFGHLSKARLKTVLRNNKVWGINPCHADLLTYCDSCALGKSRRAPAPKLSRSKATKFGERLMADNTGKLRVNSIGGCAYATVVVDEATSWVWAHPIRTLDETYRVVKDIIEVDLHQRHEHNVLYFRSDGGGDFVSHKFCVLLRDTVFNAKLPAPEPLTKMAKPKDILVCCLRTCEQCFVRMLSLIVLSVARSAMAVIGHG